MNPTMPNECLRKGAPFHCPKLNLPENIQPPGTTDEIPDFSGGVYGRGVADWLKNLTRNFVWLVEARHSLIDTADHLRRYLTRKVTTAHGATSEVTVTELSVNIFAAASWVTSMRKAGGLRNETGQLDPEEDYAEEEVYN